MATINPTIPMSPIQRDAVILYLSVGRLRTRKKLSSTAVQSDISPDMLHVSKEILQSKELKAISQHDTEVRNWIRARALPSPFSKKGLLILPVRLAEAVWEKLAAAGKARQELVEIFMGSYRERQKEAELKLGSGYDETDYPDETAVRQTFFFEVQMMELHAPGRLKAVSRELYQREAEKMANMWTEASRAVTGALLQEFRKMTAHITDRLTPDAEGKPKIFRDSAVDNLVEWMDLFKTRNLTNDADLVEVVDRAKELISGIDAETLRNSKGLRHQLATDFQGLTDRIDAAIINAPIRSIDLDE